MLGELMSSLWERGPLGRDREPSLEIASPGPTIITTVCASLCACLPFDRAAIFDQHPHTNASFLLLYITISLLLERCGEVEIDVSYLLAKDGSSLRVTMEKSDRGGGNFYCLLCVGADEKSTKNFCCPIHPKCAPASFCPVSKTA